MGESPEYWKGVEEGKKHTEPSPLTQAHMQEFQEFKTEWKHLPVTLSELLHGVASIKDTILPTITKEVKNTNGKVAEVTSWKQQVIGGAKVAGFVFAIFVAILGWALYAIVNLPATIDSRIEQTLSTHE